MSATKPVWSAGDELEERTLPLITRSQLKRYVDASGDRNSIHLENEAAKEAGLPGVIVHGMLTLAAVDLLFSPYFEHGYVKEVRARFSGTVYVGDETFVGGRVVGAEDTDEGPLYDFEVRVSWEEDAVASGTVGFLVYGE